MKLDPKVLFSVRFTARELRRGPDNQEVAAKLRDAVRVYSAEVAKQHDLSRRERHQVEDLLLDHAEVFLRLSDPEPREFLQELITAGQSYSQLISAGRPQKATGSETTVSVHFDHDNTEAALITLGDLLSRPSKVRVEGVEWSD